MGRTDGEAEPFTSAATAAADLGDQTSAPSPRDGLAAEYRRRAAVAMVRARQEIRRPWTSDAGLRVQVEAILALSPEDRVRTIEAEARLFAELRLVAE